MQPHHKPQDHHTHQHPRKIRRDVRRAAIAAKRAWLDMGV